ncbi:hypothetical protein [Longimicrobium sp.]|uniref:hypothetical protein n=1 Tax=Longimicrobium sp. TaxID=2029185 RepID=UPI002C0C642C|nr:hypothetical protein [Longimicrobium sp.]HSU13922.1 hypothetical protein [Longimicrobium sp.]
MPTPNDPQALSPREDDALPLGPSHAVPVQTPGADPRGSFLQRMWNSVFGATPFDRPARAAEKGKHQYFGGLMRDDGTRRRVPNEAGPPQA